MKLEHTTVLILDDEPAALEQSQKAIQAFVPEERILCATSAAEVIRLLEENPVQIMFIDVELNGTDGFTVADYVCRTYPEIYRVFLTGHTELGAKGYEYEALDFLSKPVDLFRLEKTFERYCRQTGGQPREQERVAVELARGFALISPEDIRYIAKEHRKTVICCSKDAYKVPYSLEQAEALFREYRFVRIHNSILAPLSRIVRVEEVDFGKTYCAILDDGTNLSVSRAGYLKLREYLSVKGIQFM